METKEFFLLGVSEFNNGRFFECHDTFEELWMSAHGEEKRFLQGLIQSAVGIFHALSGNMAGAEYELRKGISKITGYGPEFMGVNMERLEDDLVLFREKVLAALAGHSSVLNLAGLPRIELSAATVNDSHSQ